MKTFYVVATPIGNMEDITLRALRVLKEVDIILCEDTRVTRNLLKKYDISTRTESYNAHATSGKHEKIIELVKEGKILALVSDAGTPAISDPGSMLVSRLRDEIPDISIIPIPGPSAVIAALSASGLPSSEFLFLGFLPHQKGRQTLIREIVASKRTVALYESTHRIVKFISALKKEFEENGEPLRRIMIAREITKLFEEIVAGTADDILKHFESNTKKTKGEFVVLIEGR